MLPRCNRIPSEMFRPCPRGKQFFSAHLSLLVATSTSRGEARSSFSVSSKICKNAVGRNLLRRRAYSVLDELLKSIPTNRLYFFSAKTGADKLQFQDLQKEIVQLLNLSGK